MERLLTITDKTHVRQFVKFILVGLMTTGINFAIYAVLVIAGVHYLQAATIAFLFATLNSYTFNRIWTFRAGAHHHSRLAKFAIIQTTGLTINLLVLTFLVEQLFLDKLVAQVIASGCVVGVSFFGNKYWSFR